MKIYKSYTLVLFALLGVCMAQTSQAAISLDRTRVIFIGGEKSVSLSISNQNTQLPYLAQGWIENEQSEKITSPMVVLPPVQRLEAGASSQVKIQGLPELINLPQDRESLFYFNLREIAAQRQAKYFANSPSNAGKAVLSAVADRYKGRPERSTLAGKTDLDPSGRPLSDQQPDALLHHRD